MGMSVLRLANLAFLAAQLPASFRVRVHLRQRLVEIGFDRHPPFITPESRTAVRLRKRTQFRDRASTLRDAVHLPLTDPLQQLGQVRLGFEGANRLCLHMN